MSDVTPLWYETHRPRNLDEYVWRDPKLREKVERKWLAEKNPPHLIVLGPAGTGKTSLIELVIAGLGIEPQDVLRTGGVDHNVGTVRDSIVPFCQAGGWSGLKIVFIDEADNLTRSAQEDLRKVMNDFGTEVRFFMTGNFGHRLIEPLLSRCSVIQLDAIDMDAFVNRLVDIATAEAIDLDADILMKIIDRTYPDMRKAINLLQDCTRMIDEKILLVDPDEAEVRGESEWEKPVLTALTEGMSIDELRTVISGVPKEELEEFFRFCYEKSDIFPNQGRAVMIIRDAMVMHAQCGFPHINIMDMLIKLMLLQEEQNEERK